MITPKEHHAAYEIAYQIVQRLGRVHSKLSVRCKHEPQYKVAQ